MMKPRKSLESNLISTYVLCPLACSWLIYAGVSWVYRGMTGSWTTGRHTPRVHDGNPLISTRRVRWKSFSFRIIGSKVAQSVHNSVISCCASVTRMIYLVNQSDPGERQTRQYAANHNELRLISMWDFVASRWK